ncbi:MAG: TVP38/TMEM64 family protein [Rhodospirillales bacterium]|nr:TVP38/TMEM64 family protein [Rhodospirillales bacterium]
MRRLPARLVPGALLLGALGGVVAVQHFLGADLRGPALAALRAAGNHGALGLAAVFGLQVLIAGSGILPASVLGLAAGALFGVAEGFAATALGTMAGALLAFGLARSLFRQAIARLVGERGRLARMDAALAQDGWKLVCLIRISPVMPFAITSYALGLSSVRPRAYVLGTLASLPPLLGYAVMGRLAGLGALRFDTGAGANWAALGFGAAASLALGWYVMRLLRRSLAPAA